MKNLFKVTMLAAFAMAFAACSKDATEEIVPVNPDLKQPITLSVDTEMTRTQLASDNKHLEWVDGDTFGVFTDKDDKNLAVAYAEGDTSYSLEVAAGTGNVYAYYPLHTRNADVVSTAVKLEVPTAQSQDVAGTFNGYNYPMIAKSKVENGAAALVFKPVACAIAFNVYGIDGIDVETITINSEAAISGYNATDLTSDAAAYAGYTKNATVELTTPYTTAEAKGEGNEIYLVVAKQSYPAGTTIVVNGIYTFTAEKEINCTTDMLSMGLNLAKADVPKSYAYKQVKDLSQIVAGEYIIVNNGFYLPSTSTTSAPAKVTLGSIEFVDGIYDGPVAEAAVWTFTGTKEAMTLTNADGYILNGKDANNGLTVVETSTTTWAFEVNGTGFAMKNTNGRYCATYTSGSDWRSYTSPTHDNYGDDGVLYIYKKYDPSAPVVPIISVPELAIELPGAAVGETTFTVTVVDGDVANLTMVKNTEATWLTASLANGVVTYSATENTDTENARTATLTFSIEGGDDVVVTMTQAKGTAAGEIPAGTVLWAEDWTGGGKDATPSAYGQTGTTVYGGATVTYTEDSNSTKLYNDTYAGGKAPELLLNKTSGKWTITGIPTAGVKAATLTFGSNKDYLKVNTNTTGVTVSGSDKTWDITIAEGVETFDLVFSNNDKNARIDDVKLVTK